jgi:hypothetical protein
MILHGRRGWVWQGPEHFHRINDKEGMVRRRHPLRGDALHHLDPM